MKKDYDKAIRDYSEAIRLNPKDTYYYDSRANCWSAMKEYDKAISDYEEAIRLNPNSFITYNSYARLLATCPDERVRDGRRAIRMATKVCELSDWGMDWFLDTLAAAYAEAGQFDAAVFYQRKALEKAINKDEYRQRLELYKQRKPYRSP